MTTSMKGAEFPEKKQKLRKKLFPKTGVGKLCLHMHKSFNNVYITNFFNSVNTYVFNHTSLLPIVLRYFTHVKEINGVVKDIISWLIKNRN